MSKTYKRWAVHRPETGQYAKSRWAMLVDEPHLFGTEEAARRLWLQIEPCNGVCHVVPVTLTVEAEFCCECFKPGLLRSMPHNEPCKVYCESCWDKVLADPKGEAHEH